MLDTNKILNALPCKDLNQKKGETLFLIWYNYVLDGLFLPNHLLGVLARQYQPDNSR
jgi:hypothetical protein